MTWLASLFLGILPLLAIANLTRQRLKTKRAVGLLVPVPLCDACFGKKSVDELCETGLVRDEVGLELVNEFPELRVVRVARTRG